MHYLVQRVGINLGTLSPSLSRRRNEGGLGMERHVTPSCPAGALARKSRVRDGG